MTDPVIPSDDIAIGTPTGHVENHNNSADVMGLLAQVLAQGTGNGTAYPAGNAGNISQLQSFVTTGALFTGAPLDGPFASTPTVWRTADSSILAMPLAAYGLTGDDGETVNYALSQCTTPGTPGPTTVRLVSGGVYTVKSTIGLTDWVYGTYLDLNGATLQWSGPAGDACINFQGPGLSGGNYPFGYGAGGAYNGNIVNTGTNANVTAIWYGAGEEFFFDNIRVYNFQDGNTSGSYTFTSYGLHEDNTNGWTEKSRIRVSTYWCDNAFYFSVPSSGDNPSHEYNVWDLHVHAQRGQSGIVGSGNGAFTSGSRIYMYGNFGETGATTEARAAAGIDVSAGANMSKTFLTVEVETTNSGTYNWTTIKFNDSSADPPTSGSMTQSWGGLRFLDGGWATSDATSSEFGEFGGLILGDSVLAGLNTTAPPGWP